MIVRYTLGGDLTHEVKGPTIFIFNLEVAELQRRIGLVERLTVVPERGVRTYTVPDIRNHDFSLEAEADPLEVRYEAEVTLDVFRADPATVRETAVATLPLDIMPFLLPSRFVSSDCLSAFAQREFGHLDQGQTARHGDDLRRNRHPHRQAAADATQSQNCTPIRGQS